MACPLQDRAGRRKAQEERTREGRVRVGAPNCVAGFFTPAWGVNPKWSRPSSSSSLPRSPSMCATQYALPHDARHDVCVLRERLEENRARVLPLRVAVEVQLRQVAGGQRLTGHGMPAELFEVRHDVEQLEDEELAALQAKLTDKQAEEGKWR